jgi:hypothetical protein
MRAAWTAHRAPDSISVPGQAARLLAWTKVGLRVTIDNPFCEGRKEREVEWLAANVRVKATLSHAAAASEHREPDAYSKVGCPHCDLTESSLEDSLHAIRVEVRSGGQGGRYLLTSRRLACNDTLSVLLQVRTRVEERSRGLTLVNAATMRRTPLCVKGTGSF